MDMSGQDVVKQLCNLSVRCMPLEVNAWVLRSWNGFLTIIHHLFIQPTSAFCPPESVVCLNVILMT